MVIDFNMHPVNVAVVNSLRELSEETEALKAEIQSLKEKIEILKQAVAVR